MIPPTIVIAVGMALHVFVIPGVDAALNPDVQDSTPAATVQAFSCLSDRLVTVTDPVNVLVGVSVNAPVVVVATSNEYVPFAAIAAVGVPPTLTVNRSAAPPKVPETVSTTRKIQPAVEVWVNAVAVVFPVTCVSTPLEQVHVEVIGDQPVQLELLVASSAPSEV